MKYELDIFWQTSAVAAGKGCFSLEASFDVMEKPLESFSVASLMFLLLLCVHLLSRSLSFFLALTNVQHHCKGRVVQKGKGFCVEATGDFSEFRFDWNSNENFPTKLLTFNEDFSNFNGFFYLN